MSLRKALVPNIKFEKIFIVGFSGALARVGSDVVFGCETAIVDFCWWLYIFLRKWIDALVVIASEWHKHHRFDVKLINSC